VPPSSNFFRSSTFRLAAIYLLFFTLSVAAIIAYIYWNTVGILEKQTDETIRSEVLALSDEYSNDGVEGIHEVIGRRVTVDSSTIYVLADSTNRRIAGNLQGMPQEATDDKGWIDFPLTVKRGDTTLKHTGRAYYSTLEGNYKVLVGRDVEELRQFGDLIRRSLYIAIGLASVLGLGGAWLLSRNFLRRVDAITDTSRGIMAGDLSRRMPLHGTNDELDRLSMSLNQMLDQIERLMRGMREVSTNISHDLRTPLTRIRSRAEAALRSENKADVHAALTSTLDDSDQLLKVFNSLLSISRAEAGQMRENFVNFDAAEVVQDVAELYEPIVEDAGGKLTFEMPLDKLPVRADRQLLAQAITNLIDNALKYGKGQGALEIAINGKATVNTVEITVSDRGEGIAQPDRERVKERFVRLDESRNLPGSGLGLSLVDSVMKLHGGSLGFEDNRPGLIAKLVLPLDRVIS
jgi:signal transduction histidine kinase